MARHRREPRHLRTGVAGLAVVLALWCTGDGPAPGTTTERGSVAEHVAPLATGALQAPPRAVRPSAPAGSAQPPAPAPETLPASEPMRLSVERIGLDGDLVQLGLRSDRSLEVPPEGPGAPAGWYRHSPTPGEAGPSVLLGHVNATGGGPGVFAELHRLTPGDRITVTRQDGSAAAFAVDAVERYEKAAFPTLRVYGNTAGPELRLITCDGYDPATGSFDANLVVYASLLPD
ncbi:UNVERIFIED_CONTAM: class F sortase [Kocuria sp. CPCC 205316]|uniref:class F sortase n=1 Tax=Kocuria TaxID=57493 RepID=UPI0036DBBAC4